LLTLLYILLQSIGLSIARRQTFNTTAKFTQFVHITLGRAKLGRIAPGEASVLEDSMTGQYVFDYAATRCYIYT